MVLTFVSDVRLQINRRTYTRRELVCVRTLAEFEGREHVRGKQNPRQKISLKAFRPCRNRRYDLWTRLPQRQRHCESDDGAPPSRRRRAHWHSHTTCYRTHICQSGQRHYEVADADSPSPSKGPTACQKPQKWKQLRPRPRTHTQCQYGTWTCTTISPVQPKVLLDPQ